MKSYQVVLFVLLFLNLACSGKNQAAPQNLPADVAVPNSANFMGEPAEVKTALENLGAKNIRFRSLRSSLNIHNVRYEGKVLHANLKTSLDDKVQYFEPDYKIHEVAIESRARWGANDRHLFHQWALNNIGQSAPGGLPGRFSADMKVLEMWKKFPVSQSKDSEVVVGVLDTGIAHQDKELNARMWINEKEAPKNGGVAGRDEDGNKYYDDIYGYDFVTKYNKVAHGDKLGDSDPQDGSSSGHGTHCAGSIAAVANNDLGVAGVNPQARLMALKVLGDDGSGTISALIEGVGYGIDQKAHILSASLGATRESAEMKILKAVIKEAGDKGILFIAAAGNDGKDLDVYGNKSFPASFDLPNIISVGASDNQDNPAYFSNYGYNSVDLFAPGVGILSTCPGNRLCIMSGTSMAAPYVAGLASYLMSYYPELKGQPEKVKAILMGTVDKVPSMYGKVASSGRVNGLKALENTQAVEQNPIQWQQAAFSIDERKRNKELVDIRHKVHQEGAKALRIHFDFINLDTSFDSIYIYDADYKLISSVKVTLVGVRGHGSGYWSPIIIGDTAYVRFVNAKVKETQLAAPVKMKRSEINDCLREGGSWSQALNTETLATDHEHILCQKDAMGIKYADLKKETEDSNVFFSFRSEGFSVDKIEYVEKEI